MLSVNLEHLIRDNRQICIQMELLANRLLAQKDLTIMQAHALQYILLHAGEGTSLTKIQHAFGYSKATLSHILKTLREKGYIRAECCASDDRCKLLYATPKGEALGPYLKTTLQTIQKQFYSCFTPSELSVLDQLQKKMLQNLSACTKQTQQKEALTI